MRKLRWIDARRMRPNSADKNNKDSKQPKASVCAH
jgi:hypothetical protein